MGVFQIEKKERIRILRTLEQRYYYFKEINFMR
jgi:hypothetical protein